MQFDVLQTQIQSINNYEKTPFTAVKTRGGEF